MISKLATGAVLVAILAACTAPHHNNGLIMDLIRHSDDGQCWAIVQVQRFKNVPIEFPCADWNKYRKGQRWVY